MANALKDKKEEDFKKDLVNREFLEKRRSYLLEATRRMQEARDEAANEFGPSVAAFNGFLAGAEDSPEVERLRAAAAADPRSAKTMMERVEEAEARTGAKVNPNLFATMVEIHGLDGFNPEDVLDLGSVTSDLLNAGSMDDMTKSELELMGAGSGRPTVGVRIDPSLGRPEDTKLLEDQRKIYDQEMANFLENRMAASSDLTEKTTLDALIKALNTETGRAMASRLYGPQVMATLNEEYSGNPSWVGSERNPFLPRIPEPEATVSRPTTQEEYDAIPSGTAYQHPQDPEGTTRIKP